MRQRRKHYLRRNKVTRAPRQFAFVALEVDTQDETRVTSDDVRAVHVVRWWRADATHKERVEEHMFFDARDAVDYLTQRVHKKKRLVIVSESPTRDVVLLRARERLEAAGWQLGFPIVSSRLEIIPFARDDRALLFVAHRNLFSFAPSLPRHPRDAVARMFGMWRMLVEMYEQRDLGNFALTLGAQALNIYRHRFIEHEILIHDDHVALDLERRATLGAFYQPLYFGEAPRNDYYYLDTNSMYPFIMSSRPLPWRLVGRTGRGSVELLKRKLDSYLCIATVELETTEPCYPVRSVERTFFPVGRFVTTLTTPDLVHALRHGHVRAVHALAWYDGAVLFRKFVRTLWSWRCAFDAVGDTIRAKLCKAWMVALYGKFGAWRYRRVREGRVDELDVDVAVFIDLEKREAHQCFALDGELYSSRRDSETASSFPAIMAHVAAHGRRRIFQLIRRAGAFNTFAAVSDGIIVNRRGLERLEDEIDPDRLGALKVKRRAEHFAALSDVEFVLGERRWLPGVKTGAEEVEDGVFIVKLEQRAQALLNKNARGEYTLATRVVRLKRELHSGVVTESGWIAPHSLSSSAPLLHGAFALLLASADDTQSACSSSA